MTKPEPGLTPQIAIAIAVVMMALALPILCVVLALNGTIRLKPHAGPAPPAAQALPPGALDGLRGALEKAADAKLPPAGSALDGMGTIAISAADPAATGKRVLALVHDFGGNALPPEESGNSIRIVAEVDSAWQPALAACVRDGTPKPASLPPATGSTVFCEIRITHTP